MKDGLIKVAAATPTIKLADCMHNAQVAIKLAKDAAVQGVQILVLPELCLTGYTCGDLFLQTTLLDGAQKALTLLREETATLQMLVLVGLPVRRRGKVFNCAAVLYRGRVLGMVPKTWLPNYGEFAEKRQFASAHLLDGQNEMISGFDQKEVPFGTRLLFCCAEQPNLLLGVEICEDLWSSMPPSIEHAAAGATIIANLSASNETIGKDETRRHLVTSQSMKQLCGYVYASAGAGESTTDLVFAAHNLIAENGTLLAETDPFSEEMAISEIDVGRMAAERRRSTTYPEMQDSAYLRIPFSMPLQETVLTRKISATPFLPTGQEHDRLCELALRIQSHALAQRLTHVGAKTAVLGVSGGLDSSLALLVTARAAELLRWEKTQILAVTMPCFGTSERTRSNASLLCEGLGIPLREIDIRRAVEQHFTDIGHDKNNHDVTFENAQARERTQILMDLANQTDGLVVGTGDLSELALGWATYNGDHMSMYAVNASVPKTLVRELTAYEAKRISAVQTALADIIDTPVSPELLPSQGGELQQKTEDAVGPFPLNDFFLYYLLRWGFTPRKIYRLARHAFAGVYDDKTILSWLRVFIQRFFSQQFKRSCMPDGPKVSDISLSPRGDWHMPSDASAALWLAEVDTLLERQGIGYGKTK